MALVQYCQDTELGYFTSDAGRTSVLKSGHTLIAYNMDLDEHIRFAPRIAWLIKKKGNRKDVSLSKKGQLLFKGRIFIIALLLLTI